MMFAESGGTPIAATTLSASVAVQFRFILKDILVMHLINILQRCKPSMPVATARRTFVSYRHQLITRAWDVITLAQKQSVACLDKL